MRAAFHGQPKNSVVPFVGSGLSRGLPSWDALLRELVEHAPAADRADLLKAIESRQYLEVADLLESHPEVGPAPIQDVIVRRYRTEQPPPAAYTALAQLPTLHFITTNYDPWLKNALAAERGKVPNVLLPTDREVLAHLDEARLWAFYLHGDADKPESCVLSARSYRRLAHGAPAWRGAVEGLIRARHLLFLGTSLSEPHLLALFDAFQEHFQPEGGRLRHWWLGVPGSKVDAHALRTRGIEVVDYEDHGRLPEILAWLASPPDSEPTEASAGTPQNAPPQYDPARPWFFVPFRPKGLAMIGRSEGLGRVAEALGAGRPTAIGQTAAFTGIGGIGKTQLAVEFCWEHRASYPGGVYWFTADQNLDGQVIRLVDEARWVHPSTEPDVKIQIATHRLGNVRDALFVYDNLEAGGRLETLWPAPAPGSAILLTSRVDQPDFTRVVVQLLDKAQARDMLRSEAGRAPQGEDEERAAEEICDRMDGLPLALELAGGFLRRHPGRSFREYADLLARRGLTTTEQAETRFAARSFTRHEASLSDALRVARPLLDEHADLDAALDVLAWSGTASMGWPLLVELVQPADADLLRDGADLAEALRVLRREDQTPVPSSPRFRMHRLVQEVWRADRPALAHVEAVRAVLRRGAGWFQARRQDFKDLGAYEAELDHLGAWIGLADQLDDGDLRVRLRWLRAYPAWHRGRYSDSLDEIDAALGVYRALGHGDPLLEAHLRADRGHVLTLLGRYLEAMEEDKAGLDLRLRELGEAHEDTAMSLDNLGTTLGELGRHKEQLNYQTRALKVRSEVLGERHPHTARSYSNTGSAMGDLGDHDGALRHKRRALAIYREIYGDRHPDVAASLNNVGHTLGVLGRYSEALAHQTRALALRRDLLGEQHPLTATSWGNVGLLHLALKRRDQAQADTQRALDLHRESLGEHHPLTAVSYSNVGSVLIELGRAQEALVYQERALEINREKLGENHPTTATAYLNLGSLLDRLGRSRDALGPLQRSLEISRGLHGDRHDATLAACSLVLYTLHKLGQKRDVFELAKATLGRLSPSSPHYKDVVRVYNASRPPGFRAVAESPRPSPASKKKR